MCALPQKLQVIVIGITDCYCVFVAINRPVWFGLNTVGIYKLKIFCAGIAGQRGEGGKEEKKENWEMAEGQEE